MSSEVGIDVSKPKPSFAKVASSAYAPKIITARKVNAGPETFDHRPHTLHMMGTSNESVDRSVSLDSVSVAIPSTSGSGISLKMQTFVDGNLLFGTKSPEKACEGLRPKVVGMEVCNAGSISSGTSTKRSTGDDKSTASGTASILDEKESLRPDDSASIKASDDEDVLNSFQSMSTKDRQGVDLKDYPHQTGRMTAITGAYRLDERREMWQPAAVQKIASPIIAQATCRDEQIPQPVRNEGFNTTQVPANPDEMLLEALHTPRDRVFILKLEQEIMRFIQSSREPTIELPQSNSFHRLLTHRLADYYLLGHTVDNGLGAVRLHRTPYVRLPQSLAMMAKSIGLAENEPQSFPTRMIMRRDSQPRTKSLSSPSADTSQNPEGALKALPDIEGDGSSDGSQPPAKQSAARVGMSREEREAKYIEARQRIFGASEDTVTNGHNAEERDVSRSSSANGKKKVRKSKEYHNDGFEARFHSNTVYNPSLSTFSYPSDSYYFPQYPHLVQSTDYGCLNSDLPAIVSPHNHQPSSDTDFLKRAPWPGQQFPHAPSSATNNYLYSPNGTELDLSAELQHSLQIFHNPATANQTPMKSPTKPPSGTFNQFDLQQEVAHQLWHTAMPQAPGFMPYPRIYQCPATSSGPVIGLNSSTSYTQQYPYGKLPNPTIANGKSNKDQHPIPGSYNRLQQFNPHSQSFIPTSQQQANFKESLNDANSSTQRPLNLRSAHSQIAPVSCASSPKRRQGNTSALSTSAQGLANPLPQPVSVSGTGQSTIAKWGIPAHLPPKPPPPALFSQTKSVDHDPTKDVADCAKRLTNVGATSSTGTVICDGLFDANKFDKSRK